MPGTDPQTPAADAQEAHPGHPPVVVRPIAGVLALVLPGLGHLYLGQIRRGQYIALGILSLFLGGLLIGGIDAIDSREDRLWFLGQACVGPLAFVVDHLHQNNFKVNDEGVLRSAWPHEGRNPDATPRPLDPANPADRPPNIKGIAKVNELGTLFITLAGFLNIIVVLDALFPAAHRLRPSRQGGSR